MWICGCRACAVLEKRLDMLAPDAVASGSGRLPGIKAVAALSEKIGSLEERLGSKADSAALAEAVRCAPGRARKPVTGLVERLRCLGESQVPQSLARVPPLSVSSVTSAHCSPSRVPSLSVSSVTSARCTPPQCGEGGRRRRRSSAPGPPSGAIGRVWREEDFDLGTVGRPGTPDQSGG